MKIILRVLMVASAAFFYAPNLLAQGVPDHTVPIGRGAGSGFKFAAPGALGTCLLSNGPTSDPVFGACITGSAGTDTNTLNAQSGNYSIVAADAGKTIYVTGGPFTVTLPGVGGFAPTSQLSVCNGNPNSNTGRAVRLSGFPNPTPSRLYMQTCLQVAIENGAWVAKSVPGRFKPAFTPTLFFDNAGNAANDGLVSNAAGNAIPSLQSCFTILQTEYDLGGTQPFCSGTNGTIVGSATLTGALIGSNVITIIPTSGSLHLQPTPAAGAIIQLNSFSGGLIIGNNVTLDCTGGSAACVGYFVHQYGVAEIAAGAILQGNAPGHRAIFCDNICLVNTTGNFTVTGRFQNVFEGNVGSTFYFIVGAYINAGTIIDNAVFKMTGSRMNFNGLLQSGGSTIGLDTYQLRGGATACLTNYTESGAFGSARKFSVLNNSLLANFSNTVISGTAAGIVSASGFSNGFAPDNLGTNTGVNAGGC